MQTARAPGRRLEVGAVLAVIVLLGLLAAPLPFTGDQALYAVGARQLAHGDVLYRDFWDIKQPGIYLFYLGGGSLLGYSEVALHLFELAYQLAFAVVLIVTLRDRFTHRWIGPLVPLLILGTYYATIEPLQLGQVESLVGFPIYVTLWCSMRGVDSSPARVRWLFASGLAGGLVLVLKIVLAPIVGAFWLLALWQIVRAVPTGHGRTRAAGSALGAIALGVLIPIGIAVAYFAAYGQLETVRWTYFTVSPQTTAIAGRPLSRLTGGAAKTAARWAIPLALGGIGLIATARRRWDPLELGLVAWLLLGVPIFLVQHWWIYHYAMFLVPVGILAGHGLDAIVGAWPRLRSGTRFALVVAAVLLLVPAAARVASNGRDVASHGFALTTNDRAALRSDLEPNYQPARTWAGLAPVRRAPDAYVLGNPLYLYVADRPQAISIQGWSPEQYPQSVWQRLRAELERTRPSALVVDKFSREIMHDRSRETLRAINHLYQSFGGYRTDTWYRLRPSR